jgi:hypothetical protein
LFPGNGLRNEKSFLQLQQIDQTARKGERPNASFAKIRPTERIMARIYSLLLAVILLLASAPSVAHAETRTWTGRNGKQLNAELVLDEGAFVRLRDTDGKEHRIKTTNLSAADIDFLNSIRGRANASAPAGGQQQKSTVSLPPFSFGLGRSDSEILSGLGEYFPKVEPGSTIRGSSRRLGQTADKKTSLELAGDPKDVGIVTVVFTIRNNSPSEFTRNKSICVTLIKNTLPTWQDGPEWFNRVMQNTANSANNDLEEIDLGDVTTKFQISNDWSKCKLSISRKDYGGDATVDTASTTQIRNPSDSLPQFSVVQVTDHSYPGAVRKALRVRVAREVTHEELTAISTRIIKQATSQQKINAIKIFFFLPESDTDGMFTAGKATWAPDGDWSRAELRAPPKLFVEAVNPSDSIPDQDRVNLPLALKKQIFLQIVRYQDKGLNASQSHAAAAKDYEISQEDAKRISIEGLVDGWPLP